MDACPQCYRHVLGGGGGGGQKRAQPDDGAVGEGATASERRAKAQQLAAQKGATDRTPRPGSRQQHDALKASLTTMRTLLHQSGCYTPAEANDAAQQVWRQSQDFAAGEGTVLTTEALLERYRQMMRRRFGSCGGGAAACFADEASAVRYIQAAGRRYLDAKSWTPRDAKPSAHLTRANSTLPPECVHTERAGRTIAGAPPLAHGASDDFCHGGSRFMRSLDCCSHGRADAAKRDPPPNDVRDAEVPLSAACIVAAVLDGVEVVGLGSAEYSEAMLAELPKVTKLLGERAQVTLVEVESAFDFKAITTHDLIAPHTISGLANAKVHAIMVKFRGKTAHAILAPVVSRGAGERSDVGALQPLLHAYHEACHDLFVTVLLAGGAGIHRIDFNLLRFETYAEQLRRAGVNEVPAVYRGPMALSPSQLGHLHSAALAGGAERELLSYYSMAQLKVYEAKGQAAFGHGTSATKGQGSNSSSISGRTQASHSALSGGFGHFASIQLPPVLPPPPPSSESSIDGPPPPASASSLAPPPGFHVAACQACSMVIFTSKPKGGQHTSCPLAGRVNVPGVSGKVPAMPSLHYFPDDPALRLCKCMPRAAKPSDAPFVFCPGCKTRSGPPVAHPEVEPFVTSVKGNVPSWKRASQ